MPKRESNALPRAAMSRARSVCVGARNGFRRWFPANSCSNSSAVRTSAPGGTERAADRRASASRRSATALLPLSLLTPDAVGVMVKIALDDESAGGFQRLSRTRRGAGRAARAARPTSFSSCARHLAVAGRWCDQGRRRCRSCSANRRLVRFCRLGGHRLPCRLGVRRHWISPWFCSLCCD